MRVLLIPASYEPVRGGLQTVARTLARSLTARGHEVRVITNRYPRKLAAHEVLDDVPVSRWQFLIPRSSHLLKVRFDLFLGGLFYLPLTLGRMIFLLLSERPDVVNLHFVGAAAPFVLLARRFLRFRLVVSLHGDDVEGLAQRGRFDLWVFGELLGRADVVTACSRYLLDRAMQIEPAARQKGRVIYNGMDQPAEVPTIVLRESLLAAGRMVPKKGFDVLLRAFARGKQRSTLTLIGDGPEREKLEKLARELGLNGEIKFSGGRDQTQTVAEMGLASVVVIPSLQEPFGLVALEAMSLGKPIVASDVGGLAEVLEGADALLVEPGDPAALAQAIETALDRVKQDSSFGAHNRARAASFSTGHMADSYLESYGDSRVTPRITARNKLRSLLARSELLRMIRARLPYRAENWKARAMDYWQWENRSEEAILRNTCGPSATLNSIETGTASIVWLAEPKADDVCLDLGCGIGRTEKHLAPLVKEIHAVDFSATMLETARRRLAGCSNVQFYQNDGESLGMFRSAMFDLAWAELLFHHVPIEITDKYLREIARVLKSGGRFVCQLPLKDFYKLHSRDVCGWLTLEEAKQLMDRYFGRVQVSSDGRHIVGLVVKP
jgi:glycosyltransferase involved in cell wall biosynthesis/SAM-dependent methyltransferase